MHVQLDPPLKLVDLSATPVEIANGFPKKQSHSDFINLKIDLDSDLQKSITGMETLAQLGILHVAARKFPCYKNADSSVLLEWQHWRRSFYQQTFLHEQTSLLFRGETLHVFSSFRH